jgi:hypothetical protein
MNHFNNVQYRGDKPSPCIASEVTSSGSKIDYSLYYQWYKNDEVMVE